MSAASSSPSTSTSSTGTAQPPLSRTDRAFLDLAFEFKEQLPTRPILSGFRVLAIFTYTTETHTKTPTDVKNTSEEDEDEHVDVTVHDAHKGGMLDGIPYIVGTNCEISAMGQSICAERSALAKLRLIPFTSIGDIYLVSDASFELAPGLLCREFLSQWLAPQRRIILASADIGVRSGYSYTVTSLARLYPHPPLYRHHAYHADVVEYAQEVADKAQQVKTKFSNKPEWETLYQQVVDKTSSDRKDVLYPIRLAAGIRFSNGDVQLAAQTKLAEFGHTMDPLTKLLIYIENYREKDITPEVYMMSDQFGVLHPPSATARAHLFEGNHPGTLLYHDADGTLHSSDITTLVPEMPNVIESSFDQAKETLKQRKATQLRVQQQQQQHKHSATCHH